MSEAGGLLFEQKRYVHLHDCDYGLRLSVPAILRYFEEAALEQSDSLGVGFAWYHETGVGWILSKWDVRLHLAPAFRETVTVRTQPRHYRSFSANRAFWILGAEGKVLVEGASQWIFVDSKRMRPKRIPPELRVVYQMPESRDRLSWDSEPAPPEREDHVVELRVRGGDLDYNGHVNNIRYVDWALETLPDEVTVGRRPVRMMASYRGETRGGAEVRSIAQVDEAGDEIVVRHAVAEGDRIACTLQTRWRKND